jgi:hypothetical protein
MKWTPCLFSETLPPPLPSIGLSPSPFAPPNRTAGCENPSSSDQSHFVAHFYANATYNKITLPKNLYSLGRLIRLSAASPRRRFKLNPVTALIPNLVMYIVYLCLPRLWAIHYYPGAREYHMQRSNSNRAESPLKYRLRHSNTIQYKKTSQAYTTQL